MYCHKSSVVTNIIEHAQVPGIPACLVCLTFVQVGGLMELGRDKHQHRKHPIMKPLKRITKVILLITLCTLTILLVTKLYQGYHSSDTNNNYGALYKGQVNLRYFSRYSTRTKEKLTSSSLLRNGEGGSNRTSLPCSNHTHIQ